MFKALSRVFNNPGPLVVSTALVSSSSAPAQPTYWTLCDQQLVITESLVSEINNETLVLIDEFKLEHTIDRSSIIFGTRNDLPTSSINSLAPTQLNSAIISLIDGQQIHAIIEPTTNPDNLECIVYTNEIERGRASIPLERIARIHSLDSNSDSSLNESRSIEENESIITRTGDTLDGFIESIGTNSIIDTENGLVTLEFNQIQSITFANFDELTKGIQIRTMDHKILYSNSFRTDFEHATSIEINAQSIGLESSAQTKWLLDPNAIRSFQSIDPNSRIQSLAQIEPEEYEPTGDRSWTPEPIVSINEHAPIHSDIDLVAPIRIRYPLPEGSSRFACTLRSPIREWTSCNAAISWIDARGNKSSAFKSIIDGEHDSHEINFEIPPGTSSIEIEIAPGKFGAIQDRVIIESPRLLIVQ